MIKHSIYATLMLVAILFLSACAQEQSKQQPTAAHSDTVTILHTNDFHSQVEPFYPEGEPSQGGAARLSALVSKIRADKGDSNVLLLSGGDMFQGSLFYNTWMGSAEVMIHNHMRYDAVALGNHEFDSGSEELGRALRGEPVTIASKHYATEPARFVVLGTNIEHSAEPALDGLIVKRAIIKKGGNTYGLLGLTTLSTKTGSSPGENVHFLDYVPAVQEQVDALKAEGVEKIILTSHIGYEIDVVNVPQLSGVDVIVSGHDHALLGDAAHLEALGIPNQVSRLKGPYPTLLKDKDGNTTVVVSAMEKGRWLGNIDVSFDEKGNIIETSVKADPIFVRGCDVLADKTEDCSRQVIAPEAALAAKIALYNEPLEAFANEELGEATVTFAGRAREDMDAPAMGDLIADVLLDRAKATNRADAALVNRGGIRTALNKGTVLYKDVNAVMPFNNTLSLIDLTGDELISALDHGLTLGGGESYGAFPHVSGMTVTHCAAVPCAKALHADGVVTAVKIAGKPLDKAKTYRIATIDYLIGGGDMYTSLKTPCEREGNYCRKGSVMIRDILADWFRNHSPVGPKKATRLVVAQ